MSDPIGLFKLAIAAAGLTPPDTINADGKIHRFNSNGKPRDDSGWYMLHLDGIAAGAFGCWRAGFTQTWCAKSEDTMTQAERDAHRGRIVAMQAQREAEQVQRQQQARDAVAVIHGSARNSLVFNRECTGSIATQAIFAPAEGDPAPGIQGVVLSNTSTTSASLAIGPVPYRGCVDGKFMRSELDDSATGMASSSASRTSSALASGSRATRSVKSTGFSALTSQRATLRASSRSGLTARATPSCCSVGKRVVPGIGSIAVSRGMVR